MYGLLVSKGWLSNLFGFRRVPKETLFKNCLFFTQRNLLTYFSKILFLGTNDAPDKTNTQRLLGRGCHYMHSKNDPTCVCENVMISVKNFMLNLTTFAFADETLEDYPDSPGPGVELTTEAASNILDSEDAMDTAGPSLRSTDQHSFKSNYEEDRVCQPKRRIDDSASRSDSASVGAGPVLPPIYHSIAKKRLSKTILRHLDGSKETECTTLGASVSQTLQVGSFNNIGDRRHNGTIHRHDHTTMRNISTSFDPNTLSCTTCQGGHKVLHRTVEGTDVGMNNPPVFILTDQNFPAMVPVGGEGECLKILQVENGTLVELVEVFLGMTRGFDVPAGAVVLISSPSHAATIGTADYAAEFVRASGQLRGAFAGGINILHGVPFLLGGTTSSIAIRTMAEVEQWVLSTMQGTDDISATRKAFANSLCTSTLSHAHNYILRLPATQTNSEKVSFLVSGFDNLKTAVEPLSEEDEKALLVLLLEELNNLYPLNLCTDVICDRFMEDEVFTEGTTDRTDLVLIGASHLARLRNHFSAETWNIVDLTIPGWRINNDWPRKS